MFQCIILAVLMLVILLLFGMAALQQTGAVISLALLYLFYLPVNVLAMYIVSFLFDRYETITRTMHACI